MRMLKYLMGLWTGVAIYSLFSLFGGQAGFSAYSQLEAERERQEANMRDLDTVREQLENTKTSLAYDQDTLTVHARRLDYGREDERFIRIVGLKWPQNPHTEAGRVYFAGNPDFISDKTIKIIALCAALTVFAIFWILEFLQFK